MQQEKYNYGNLPIPGGGYVTGFVFHEMQPNVAYIRTDIGGAYRYEPQSKRWESLIDHVTMDDLRETFPIALALDLQDANRLYIASGIWDEKIPGKLSVSTDGGHSFTYYDMPMRVHGNLNGRGTGYRLIVDRLDSNRLYFASQADGLWVTKNQGKSWAKLTAMPEDYLTFVGQTKDGSALIVGSAGITTKRSATLRGKGVYVSYDGGKTFETMWQPEDKELAGVKLAGLVPQRYMADDRYFYVTFSVMGENAYVLEHGYSCDGGSVICGRVVRYPIEKELERDDLNGEASYRMRLGKGEDITPDPDKVRNLLCPGGESVMDSGVSSLQKSIKEEQKITVKNLPFGFGGIAVTAQTPGLVVVSTISKGDGDCMLRSLDYGENWTVILHDLDVGKMDFRTEYMTPKYNGGHNLIHWLTDLKINPANTQELWFNTGTGVFRTQNLLDDTVVFSDWCDGLEETVHLNLYSPPKGNVKLIDILGDLGGFAFTDLHTPCDNSFADAEGNRYITCINADYSDTNPDTVIVTPRGNWTGKTKGGLILSTNQCQTFQRLPMPYGLSDKLDVALHRIETPNVNSGWVAIAPNGTSIVWSVAEGIDLPIDQVVVSADAGASFAKVCVYDLNGRCISDTGKRGFKVFSDRMDSHIFYGFGEHSQFYISKDGGHQFYQRELPEEFPVMKFSMIDCANKTEVRGETGKQGVFYIAMRENGLWKLHYDANTEEISLNRLGEKTDIFYRMGLGVKRPGGSYANEDKAIYVAATIAGEYGFYRSVDDGEHFVRLNTPKQMYGEINSMEGDSQEYGRFYIATGSRGVLYGEPETSL